MVTIFNLLTCRPSGAMAGNHIDIIILIKPRRGGMSIAHALSHTSSPVGATCSQGGRRYKQHFHPPLCRLAFMNVSSENVPATDGIHCLCVIASDFHRLMSLLSDLMERSNLPACKMRRLLRLLHPRNKLSSVPLPRNDTAVLSK